MTAKTTQSKNKSASNVRATKSRAFPLAVGQRLVGKVAVVTGASRGIGFAIAHTLASEGCNVIMTGRNQKTLNATAHRIGVAVSQLTTEDHPAIVAQICDVRDPKSVSLLFDRVKQQFKRIDILVNNAGVAQPNVSVEEMSLEVWHNVVDTNLTGTFLCTRAALPLMSAGATIVNNLSITAKTAFPNFAAYNAAKQGALGFTLTLRLELMSRGIRVVGLIAGATDTDIWKQFWPDAPRERMMDVESVAQGVLYAALLPPNANLSELVLTPTAGAL